jgi:putative membrane protein
MKRISLFFVPVLLIGMAAAQTSGSGATSGQSGSSSSGGSSQSSGQMSPYAEHFLMSTAMGNQAEIELGQMAQQKASSQAVKQFAQQLVQDHQQAGQQLQTLAQQKGVSVQQQLPDEARMFRDRMQNVSGKQFDSAFMNDQIVHHAKEVQAFELMSQNSQDQAIKNFATQMLPKLQQHLQQAKSVAQQLQ